MALFNESKNIADGIARLVPAVREVNGVGFPHYYSGLNTANESLEINEHLEETLDKIKNDKLRNPDGWPCPTCQDSFDHPDLRTYCQECPIVTLRPRDLFRSLPDLDIIAVANDQPNLLAELEDAVHTLGYSSSDSDITRSFRDAANQLLSESGRLPLDLHLMTTSQFSDALSHMEKGKLDISVRTYSLHKGWEIYNLPFGFDFIFSLTPLLHTAPELCRAIAQTRSKLVQQYGTDGLLQFARNAFPRAKRLMKDKKLELNLRRKFDSWASADMIYPL